MDLGERRTSLNTHSRDVRTLSGDVFEITFLTRRAAKTNNK